MTDIQVGKVSAEALVNHPANARTGKITVDALTKSATTARMGRMVIEALYPFDGATGGGTVTRKRRILMVMSG